MGKLLRIVARRLINALVTIFGIIVLNYVLVRMMPGDPAVVIAPRLPGYEGLIDSNRQLFGLDRGPWEQFVIYLQRTVTLDWGISYRWNQPVAEILMRDLGWTLLLVGTAT